MARRRLKPVRLFCSDLDGTLIGPPEAAAHFRDAWDRATSRPLLAYSSGRLVDDIRELIDSTALPEPDFIIGGVGTMMVDVSAGTELHQFMHSLSDNWDRNIVDDVLRGTSGAERQPDAFLHEWKSSWYLHDAPDSLLGEIEAALAEAGLHTQLIYSSNRDLDIVPAAAGKGAALVWLCEHLGITTSEAVVAGDTGNDASMFLVPGVRGIIVGNALPELLAATTGAQTFHSRAPCAQGAVDGLRHYGALA